MSKKAKLELNVAAEIKAKLAEDTRGMDVTNWTTHVSSTKGRSVTLTLRPPCPKIAVI